MSQILLGALLSLLLTGTFIQLAKRFGWGKAIREAGPDSHQVKAGTPTMAGAAFLLAATIAFFALPNVAPQLLADSWWADHFAVIALTLGIGIMGLLDDMLALRRKRAIALGLEVGTGLLARYRLLGQGALALAFAIFAVNQGHALFGIVWLDVLAYLFVIVGAVNAFNFTDGVDGLAGGVSTIVLIFFIASPFAGALIGALLGFLWYNSHPAKAFMGGVGSEALGAAVAALAIVQGTVWYLPLIAIIPVAEVLSVVIQVAYFKATGGKRFFKMTPIHHHFEIIGWPETRIVGRAYVITAVALAAGLLIKGAVG